MLSIKWIIDSPNIIHLCTLKAWLWLFTNPDIKSIRYCTGYPSTVFALSSGCKLSFKLRTDVHSVDRCSSIESASERKYLKVEEIGALEPMFDGWCSSWVKKDSFHIGISSLWKEKQCDHSLTIYHQRLKCGCSEQKLVGYMMTNRQMETDHA